MTMLEEALKDLSIVSFFFSFSLLSPLFFSFPLLPFLPSFLSFIFTLSFPFLLPSFPFLSFSLSKYDLYLRKHNQRLCGKDSLEVSNWCILGLKQHNPYWGRKMQTGLSTPVGFSRAQITHQVREYLPNNHIKSHQQYGDFLASENSVPGGKVDSRRLSIDGKKLPWTAIKVKFSTLLDNFLLQSL